jgi:hypothetical protein
VAERLQEGQGITKLDVLHHFASYPYTMLPLQETLAANVSLPAMLARDPPVMEAHYAAYHRLLHLTVAMLRASAAAATAEDPNVDADDLVEARTLTVLPQAAVFPSSGYVVHTLAAALYVFLATSTFEAGALLMANMGDDADTVAAVYRALTGAWYAVEEDSEKQAEGQEALFWSPQMREWRDALVKRDVVEAVADELVAFVERAPVPSCVWVSPVCACTIPLFCFRRLTFLHTEMNLFSLSAVLSLILPCQSPNASCKFSFEVINFARDIATANPFLNRLCPCTNVLCPSAPTQPWFFLIFAIIPLQEL